MRCGQEGLLWSSVCENKNLKLKVGARVENLEAGSHAIKDRMSLTPTILVCLCIFFFTWELEFFPPCNIHTQVANHAHFP